MVQIDAIDRGDGGIGIRIGRQQDPAGIRVELNGFLEKLRARHSGHPLIDHKKGHGRSSLLQLANGVERLFA